MKPLEQTRIGNVGNCFATCLASILETGIPEFGVTDDPGYWEHVDSWLRARGLQYSQVPIGDVKPAGWHTIEGVSPRGGMHAVVGKDGEFVHDPHPVWDDARRGLRKPMYYGLLLPTKQRAKDAVNPIAYVKNLFTNPLKVEWTPEKLDTVRQIVENLKETIRLIESESPLSPARKTEVEKYKREAVQWQDILQRNHARDRADMLQLRKNTERQGGPFHIQVTGAGGEERTIPVRNAVDTVEPIPPFKPGDKIRLANKKTTAVRSIKLAENLFHEPEWHIMTTSGDAVTIAVGKGEAAYKSNEAYKRLQPSRKYTVRN